MKTTRNKMVTGISLIAVALGMLANTGCKKEEDPEPERTITYDLNSKDVIGVSGTVKFTEVSGSLTKVEIALTNITTGNHPAHIHINSASEGGGVAISLNPVDATGKSITSITTRDNGSTINYSQLISFDGYIAVHQSSSNLSTILAIGDIGGNELTGQNKTYNLAAVNASGISGTAVFEERKNGNTFITLDLDGTIAPGSHPAHIHLGSLSTVGGGPIKRSLSNVDAASGTSYTNVRTLDDGVTTISYDNWLVYDGYINMHLSDADLGVILAHGNIGSNQ